MKQDEWVDRKDQIRLEGIVTKHSWGPDDTFLAVNVQVQVFEHAGYKEGDKVVIIVEKK